MGRYDCKPKSLMVESTNKYEQLGIVNALPDVCEDIYEETKLLLH
jgi:hypothetical protein